MAEQANQNGPATGAAPATAADIASLQRRIEQLDAAVSQATNGLELYRSEEDIIERIRKRFIYMLWIVAVLSFFGIQGIGYVIIDQQWGKELKARVYDATVAVTKAQMSTEQASNTATEASNAASEASVAVKNAREIVDAAVLESKSATTKATEAAELARKKAEAVTGSFDEIEERLEMARAKVESEIAGASGSVRAAADKSIADIQNQLANIQDQINAVSSAANVNVARLKDRQQVLRDEAEETRKVFAENGLISVVIIPVVLDLTDAAHMLSRDLIQNGGFNARVADYSHVFQKFYMPSLTIGSDISMHATIRPSNNESSFLPKLNEISDIIIATDPSIVVAKVESGTVPIVDKTLPPSSFRLWASLSVLIYLSNEPIEIQTLR